MDDLNKTLIYSYFCGLILSGTANTILLSLQFTEFAVDVKYSHPWFQAFTMFIGETYCLIVYYVVIYYQKREKLIKQTQSILHRITEENKSSSPEADDEEHTTLNKMTMKSFLKENKTSSAPKYEASVYLYIIPSMCDLLGSTLVDQ